MKTQSRNNVTKTGVAERFEQRLRLDLQQHEGHGLRETRRRVAIVDDEPLIRELLETILGEAGYDAAVFHRAGDALEALRFTSFDAILCDIRMPGMSGLEFHAQVRARDRRQAERFLFLTGDPNAPATQAFMAQSGSLCLRKPFRQSELRAKMEELYARCEASEDTIALPSAA